MNAVLLNEELILEILGTTLKPMQIIHDFPKAFPDIFNITLELLLPIAPLLF
jgi:hypothetical protein